MTAYTLTKVLSRVELLLKLNKNKEIIIVTTSGNHHNTDCVKFIDSIDKSDLEYIQNIPITIINNNDDTVFTSLSNIESIII